MDLTWSAGQMSKAHRMVIERFALNSVAGHLSPHSMVEDRETTVRTNRFDFARSIVIDRETFGLFEPFSYCRFSKAQVDEFGATQGEEAAQTRVVATLVRAASNLARWHDVLFFRGFSEGQSLRPPPVEMPAPENPPRSLREEALGAEAEEHSGPVPVGPPLNESLVAATYEAVLRLESRGYFTAYHLVLGQDLWQELHRPTPGSMVLPRDRIEPTLMGGSFYRTTTLPNDEALLASLDGPTFDCVIAGDPAQHPRFEFLRVEFTPSHEEFYLFRVRELFAPRVRENRAIVRLRIEKVSAPQ
jgi:encapsulating protein for peroxidase